MAPFNLQSRLVTIVISRRTQIVGAIAISLLHWFLWAGSYTLALFLAEQGSDVPKALDTAIKALSAPLQYIPLELGASFGLGASMLNSALWGIAFMGILSWASTRGRRTKD